jgi:hypothetical protein
VLPKLSIANTTNSLVLIKVGIVNTFGGVSPRNSQCLTVMSSFRTLINRNPAGLDSEELKKKKQNKERFTINKMTFGIEINNS